MTNRITYRMSMGCPLEIADEKMTERLTKNYHPNRLREKVDEALNLLRQFERNVSSDDTYSFLRWEPVLAYASTVLLKYTKVITCIEQWSPEKHYYDSDETRVEKLSELSNALDAYDVAIQDVASKLKLF